MKKCAVLTAKAGLCLVMLPALLSAYSSGPDPGYAGVPGESTCASCHSGGSGSGSVKVTFATGNYTPAVKQHFTVTVADSAQRRWGFQLTARQSNTTSQAGTFTPGSDGYTQLATSGSLQYIEHTTAGTRNGTGNSVNFDFDWTPPATDVGPVNIYVAGNAANGDGGQGGDHIYTAHYTLSGVAAVKTPTISAVVNAASFQPRIQAGSFVAITGKNLANSTRSWSSADFVNGSLPTALDGVSVTINNKPAYLNYISPTQINLLAPADGSLGNVAVVVSNNGLVSSAGNAQLAAQSPSLFLWPLLYVVATHLDNSYVGPDILFPGKSIPAKPGEIVILWGTGFGATSPAAPDGQFTPISPLYQTVNLPTATVGGIVANVSAAVLTPTAAGLYQIVLQIPAAAQDGDQEIIFQTGGVQSPGGVYIAVQH